MRGVILYGPPAAGKDTITRALRGVDPAYVQFERLKAGGGRTTGYRMTDADDLAALRDRGEVVWENQRYDATYVVDQPELARLLSSRIPVVHLGQLDAIDAVTTATPDARWLVVYLHCPRDVAAARIAARGTRDDASRLEAWDLTEPAQDADLSIDTARVRPAEAARLINEAAS